jgi:GT2 family glycosyltransferase
MQQFAIGIPTLNRADLLLPTLEKYVVDFHNTEIYIIDNGKQGIKEWATKYPQIIVSEEETNLGVAASWNKLCRLIYEKHEYALICNDDIYLGYNPSTIDLSIALNGLALIKSYVSFSVFLLSKHYYYAIGEFDEQFYPAYYEDSDYIYRMKLFGSGFYIDKNLDPIQYIINGTYDKNPQLVNDAMAINKERYIQKWGGMPLLETKR